MTYKDWTTEQLAAEIKRLEEKLHAVEVLLQVEEIPTNTESINTVYHAEVTLTELRKEWKQRR